MPTTDLNDQTWHHFHIGFEIVTSSISFLINGVVLLLASKNHKQSKTTMNSYSTLVICTTLTDLCFSLVNLVTMEIAEMRIGGLFFINDNPLLEHISNATAMKLSALWILGVYTAVMNIGFQFYHRYQVVVKSHMASTRQTFLSFGVCMLTCGVLCWTVLFSWIPSNENPEYAKELEDDAVFRGRHLPFSVADPRVLRCVLHLMASQVFIFIIYGVVIFCCVRIVKVLGNEASHMSKITRQANKTLNRAMMIQAIFPFILIGIPYIIGLGGTFLQIKSPILAQFLTMSITLLPIANATTLLTVIPSYRRRFVALLRMNSSKIEETTNIATKVSKISVEIH